MSMSESEIYESELGPVLPDVGALLSNNRVYRYWLGRATGVEPRSDSTGVTSLGAPYRILFCMLNPSWASETEDDPTIRKLLSYARAWGFERLDVVNLFAWRSPSPKALLQTLREARDIVGPHNDVYLDKALRRAHRVVVAWGMGVPLAYKVTRTARVFSMIKAASHVPEYLELTKDGTPKHPLYLRGSLVPKPLPIRD